MNREGLRNARQSALWKEGLEFLDGITVDGAGNAGVHLEGLTDRYGRALARHKESGSLASAGKQLRALAMAADGMAASLGQLGLEARQAIFGGGLGGDAGPFRDGYPFDGGWLPSEEHFTEFAKSCRDEADSCGSLRQKLAGMPHFLELVRRTSNQMADAPKFHTAYGVSPNLALVMDCHDALLRVGRTEKLKPLVRVVAELTKGKLPPRFAERECQMYAGAHIAESK